MIYHAMPCHTTQTLLWLCCVVCAFDISVISSSSSSSLSSSFIVVYCSYFLSPRTHTEACARSRSLRSSWLWLFFRYFSLLWTHVTFRRAHNRRLPFLFLCLALTYLTHSLVSLPRCTHAYTYYWVRFGVVVAQLCDRCWLYTWIRKWTYTGSHISLGHSYGFICYQS